MILREPAYYRDFHCVADRCPDSCCKEWDVQIDEYTAEKYRALNGALGKCLREVMYDDPEYGTMMSITDGRCPMWLPNGLCRIQSELGETALCKTCREFPRLTHDYGSFVEKGLELSCPEAARLIINAPAVPPITREVPGGEAPEYDEEVMDILLQTRENMLAILSDPGYSTCEALAIGLMYGYHVQAMIDGEDLHPFDSAAALEEAGAFACSNSGEALVEFYKGLEILTEKWKNRLLSVQPAEWSDAFRALARYGVERYWLQAVSDYDLVCRVKMILSGCILIRLLGEDLLETAQLYSKEIENNTDNVEAIWDAAYTHSAFTDDKLLGILLAAETQIQAE